MKDLMMLYGVTLGSRRTKRQKALFEKETAERYSSLGYNVDIQRGKSPHGAFANIVAGDASKAKVVVAAAYDTPSKCLLPGLRYFPLHSSKNLSEEKRDLVFRLGLLTVAACLAFIPFRQFLLEPDSVRYAFLAIAILLMLLGTLALRYGNCRFNFNRNSASLAVMAEVAQNLGSRDKAAFVFLDSQASSFFGIRAFRENVSIGNAPILVLDCLAHGKNVVLASRDVYADMARRFSQYIKQLDPIFKEYTETTRTQNVTGIFENTLYLVSGQAEQGEFVVKSTRSGKDFGLDLERLETIAKAITQYIKES